MLKKFLHTPGVEMNLLNSKNTNEFNFDFEKKTFSENPNFLLWDDTIYLEGAKRASGNVQGHKFSSRC